MVKENQISTKPFWYGFGAVMIVLVIVGLVLIIKEVSISSNSEEPPTLPSIEDDVEDEQLSIPQLPSENSPLTNSPEISSSLPKTPDTQSLTIDNNLVGAWRVYSERLFYDEGGGGTTLSASNGDASTTKLVLDKNGDWKYGSSSGTWKVESIKNEDWTSWKINSYGPVRKLILNGWNKGTASGPIEESDNNIDFIWILYRSEPPISSKPGTVNMKLGR